MISRRALLACLCAVAGAALGARPARAMTLDKTQAKCATCHFWIAPRKAQSGERVVVEVAERGRCNSVDSLYRNLWVGPLHACPQYLLWEELDLERREGVTRQEGLPSTSLNLPPS